MGSGDPPGLQMRHRSLAARSRKGLGWPGRTRFGPIWPSWALNVHQVVHHGTDRMTRCHYRGKDLPDAEATVDHRVPTLRGARTRPRTRFRLPQLQFGQEPDDRRFVPKGGEGPGDRPVAVRTGRVPASFGAREGLREGATGERFDPVTSLRIQEVTKRLSPRSTNLRGTAVLTQRQGTRTITRSNASRKVGNGEAGRGVSVPTA
jgi:hypothetical protein